MRTTEQDRISNLLEGLRANQGIIRNPAVISQKRAVLTQLWRLLQQQPELQPDVIGAVLEAQRYEHDSEVRLEAGRFIGAFCAQAAFDKLCQYCVPGTAIRQVMRGALENVLSRKEIQVPQRFRDWAGRR